MSDNPISLPYAYWKQWIQIYQRANLFGNSETTNKPIFALQFFWISLNKFYSIYTAKKIKSVKNLLKFLWLHNHYEHYSWFFFSEFHQRMHHTQRPYIENHIYMTKYRNGRSNESDVSEIHFTHQMKIFCGVSPNFEVGADSFILLGQSHWNQEVRCDWTSLRSLEKCAKSARRKWGELISLYFFFNDILYTFHSYTYL